MPRTCPRSQPRSARGYACKEKARTDYLRSSWCAVSALASIRRGSDGLTAASRGGACGRSGDRALSEIKTRRKPGSFSVLAKLAAALRVSLDNLAAWIEPENAKLLIR